MATRIEQSIFKNIVQMAYEMQLADKTETLQSTVGWAIQRISEWVEIGDDEEAVEAVVEPDFDHPIIQYIEVRITDYRESTYAELNLMITTTEKDTITYVYRFRYENYALLLADVEAETNELIQEVIDAWRDHHPSSSNGCL